MAKCGMCMGRGSYDDPPWGIVRCTSCNGTGRDSAATVSLHVEGEHFVHGTPEATALAQAKFYKADAATVGEASEPLREKLIELADQLDAELTTGVQWSNAQFACFYVSDDLRKIVKKAGGAPNEKDWKARALEAEKLNRQFMDRWNAENGPTHMGEPVIAAQQQAEPSDKLDAPAQVGNTVFRKGVTTRLVIEAAQRNYQRIHNPTEEDKRIAAGVESITQLRKQIEQEHDAKSPFQREVEKMGKQRGARHD